MAFVTDKVVSGIGTGQNAWSGDRESAGLAKLALEIQALSKAAQNPLDALEDTPEAAENMKLRSGPDDSVEKSHL